MAPNSPADDARRAPASIDEIIERVVTDAIQHLLAPYLVKLSAPEPLVYTVTQAAHVLQVSPDTIARLVRIGVLARVPHVGGKTLIPKAAVEALVRGDVEADDDAGSVDPQKTATPWKKPSRIAS